MAPHRPSRLSADEADGPLISTITPCFGGEPYLAKFLDNAASQTWFERLEIVLDLNEPSDHELNAVREFETNFPGRLQYQVVDPVEPIGRSMNRCIRQSSGQFLTIWNVDDLRPPTGIEEQATVLAEKPEVDIVHTDYVIVGAMGETDGEYITAGWRPREEFTRSMLLGPNFMFRRSLVDVAGPFDEQLRQGADFDLAIRLAMHGKPHHIPRPLMWYLNEGVGLSNRPDTLLPVERTVIELRYGIYDKLDYSQLPQATRYEVCNLIVGEERHDVAQFVPAYDELLAERARQWLSPGLMRSALRAGSLGRAVRPLRRVAARVANRLG